jgi:uncharacterized repeat protein (TIGR03803 family)
VYVLLAASCCGTRYAVAEIAFQQFYEFPASAPGPWQPATCLVEGTDGHFYGTTLRGGSNDLGTVFKATSTGSLTLLLSFDGSNGLYPRGGMILGNDGNLYGTTSGTTSTNFGTVFRMTQAAELKTIFSFQGTNGSSPYGRLRAGSDGMLYGTTSSGGQAGLGAVFGMSSNGVLMTLVSFYGTNGSNPYAGLSEDADGDFFGTTPYGGSNFLGAYTGHGTVFRMNTNGTLSTLIYFNGTNGSQPMAGLARGLDGNFYGTTSAGGVNGLGTIFRLTSDGVLTTLIHFGPAGPVKPFAGLTQGNDGAFYGTTAYSITNSVATNGMVFKLTTNGMLTTIIHLDGTNGIHPFTDLLLASDSNLYGAMADATLAHSLNGGTLFRLVYPPLITSIVLSNSSTTLSWSSFSNGLYRVERTASLIQPDWMARLPLVTAQGPSASFNEPTLGIAESHYRIVLLP